MSTCEAFSVDGAPAQRLDGELLAEPIVFKALPPPAASVIAQFGTPTGNPRSVRMAGRNATILEHTFQRSNQLPEVHAYSYVIDLGRFVLVGQLAVFSADRAAYDQGKQALDSMVGSLELDSERCRNRSDDVRCGPFYFDPEPAPNQPLTLEVTVVPSNPRVGETVEFKVTASDPDADAIELSTSTYGDEGAPPIVAGEALPQQDGDPAHFFLSHVRSRNPFSGPSGRWVPPPIARGTRTVALYHTYGEVGDFQASFSFASANTNAPYSRDPYRSYGSTSVVVPVR